MKNNKLLLILAFFFILNTCNNLDKQNEYKDYYAEHDIIEAIIVNKIPRGACAGEEMPEGREHIGWYEIGLSRNGKEPIEWVWTADRKPFHYAIMDSEIGDKGTIAIQEWAKKSGIMLPRPNAEKPPLLDPVWGIYWENQK